MIFSTRMVPLVFFASCFLILIHPPLAAEETEQIFQILFNGRDLSGWHGRAHYHPLELQALEESAREQQLADWLQELKAHWRVEDGQIVNDGKGPYLTTDQEFGDVELMIEYKTVPVADSGIYLRGCPQVQIWDPTYKKLWPLGGDKGSGGLWNNSPGRAGKDPLVKADRPFGEWNQFRVVQVGARTSVWLNGQLVVDHAAMENYWDRTRPLFARGPIQLQTHGGEIRWRNLRVRNITAREANRWLQSHGDEEGFESVFNGRDFTGWQGALKNYEVHDGAIVCEEGHGGLLFTKKKYADFIARLEFRLPPGGNNGLAIRYPGDGLAHLTGMTELQVLDSEHPKYASLDPRQYHGSAYGMVPAHRGYLRPPGEWNYQQVTVIGSTLNVELNGTTILDADLSTVTELMGKEPYPGRDVRDGYFGFLGHGDPVAFRSIRVKPLETQ
ncbi:MAG: hypothetical protein CMJ81_24220 [Planctomycetaceae bacterium]|nr:hypothetical protein [Planctomycetaceae bacterium]